MKASEVLEAIESYVDDDFAEEMNCELGFGRLRGRSKEMAHRLSEIYKIVHSFQVRHSCHHAHSVWRRGTRERLNLIRAERTVPPAAPVTDTATSVVAARKSDVHEVENNGESAKKENSPGHITPAGYDVRKCIEGTCTHGKKG